MVERATKTRWRRLFRRRKQQVEHLGESAEQQLDQHFFRRLNRFVGVRRFVFGWVFLIVLLIGGVVIQTRGLSRFYQVLRPGSGGIFVEGIVGRFSNANPIYATGAVDGSVSRLVFAGLMKYNNQNELVPDLAEDLNANPDGSVYTVRLRKNLTWHDGTPLTADDVVFTYQTIQKPDARSPFLANWQEIDIKAKDKYTVTFMLPHGLASFPHSLTNGIVPKHILGRVPADELRSASFNTTKPIGSGPFKWEDIQVTGGSPDDREEQVGLVAFENYHSGPPKLGRFVIRAFHNQDNLKQAFRDDDVDAAAGLNSAPSKVDLTPTTREYNIPLTGEVMIFLKNSTEILNNRSVRRALVQATNQNDIIKALNYPVIYAKSPLLTSHSAYSSKNTQLPFNIVKAKQTLDKAGWKAGPDGIRVKKKQRLTFTLYSESDSEYAEVAKRVQEQWKKVGVDLKVTLEPDTKLQTTIAFHGYESLLYGVTLGSDPDVYAYWHSSQADPRASSRLNLSEYKSAVADASLEAGRSRLDKQQRKAKYIPFLKAWRNDAPAIALYQPRYLYLTGSQIFDFEPTVFNSPVDRYSNVENWAVRQDRQDVY